MNPFRRDLMWGLCSGFPLCCILYYFVSRTIGWMFLNINHWRWYEIWDKIFPKSKVHFIQCPICVWRKVEPVEYTCDTCGWVQHNYQQCVPCKMRAASRKPVILKKQAPMLFLKTVFVLIVIFFTTMMMLVALEPIWESILFFPILISSIFIFAWFLIGAVFWKELRGES